MARGKGLDLVVPKQEWWADLLPRSSLGSVSAALYSCQFERIFSGPDSEAFQISVESEAVKNQGQIFI